MENKSKRNDRYILIPLCLLQGTYQKQKIGWEIIICFGIVNYAKKIKYDINNVAKQLMYAYYRNKNMIQNELFETLERLIGDQKLTTDEQYNSFNDKSFEPLETSSELLDLFEGDPAFKEASILRYQIEQAVSMNNLGLILASMDDTLWWYNQGLTYLNDFERKFGKDCWLSVKPLQAIDFRDSNEDLDLYRAYLAIKSLIGYKKYIETTRSVILMRMFGSKSYQALQDFLKSNPSVKDHFDKYSRTDKAMRYNFNKLFTGLFSRGFIRGKLFVRGISRKIFLSIELTNDELAGRIIENSKKKNLIKSEQEAIKKIRATI